MSAAVARWLLVFACVSMLGPGAYAGNQLQVVQTANAPCNSYGGGNRIAVSADGAHVYEYKRGCDSFRITVSSRDAGSGQLTTVQIVDASDSWCGVDPQGMELSPDGNHLYLHRDRRMRIFDRDAGSGTISAVATLDLGDFTASFQISPDGAHLYLVRHENFAFDSVEVFTRDATTGALAATGSTVVLKDVHAIAVSPDGAHVYVATVPDNISGEAVRTYGRDPSTGLLTLLGATGMSPNYRASMMALSGDGANVYVATVNSSGSDRLLTFGRDAVTGLLTPIDDDDATGELSGFDVSVAPTPDGEQVYISFNNALIVFDRNAADGSLDFKEQHIDQVIGVPDGLAFIGGVAIPPDGAHVYTIGEGTVTFGRDGATGALTFLRNVEADERSSFLVGSPDGKHLYRWCTHTVVTFDRDGSTGLVTQTASVDAGSLGIGIATDARMAPDGEHIYVWDFEQGVVVLDRDPVTGGLNDVATHVGMRLPTSFSPDGKNAYGFLGFANDLQVLTRNAMTGLLAPLATYSLRPAFDDAEFVDGRDVVVSPDGSHAYVAAVSDEDGSVPGLAAGIAAFARDAGTGALTFSSTHRVNGGGGAPFDEIRRLAPSADGTLVYATVFHSVYPVVSDVAGVSAFARNAGTGALSPKYALRTTLHGGSLLAAPNGTLLYALGTGGLQVLRSDPATGALGFVETVPADVTPYDVSNQVLAPDGRRLYVLLLGGDVMVLANRSVCGAAPAGGCVGAAASKLKISAQVGPSDIAVWKWKAPGPIVLGDPLATTEYALCVYDDSAAPQPGLSSAIPPGRVCGARPCWTAAATGYKYVNRVGDPDGIATIRMVSGASGTASIALKGKGASLPPLALPYALPVTVQLQGSNGECWEASYGAGISDARQFKAKQ